MHAGGPWYEPPRPPRPPRLRVSRLQARAAKNRLNGPAYQNIPAAERVALRAIVQDREETMARWGGWFWVTIILLWGAGILIGGCIQIGPAIRAGGYGPGGWIGDLAGIVL